jgi:hypothetical protein
MTTFYGSVFPLSWLIVSFGLLLSYYFSKFMLIKRSRLTHLSYKLSKRVVIN